MKKNDFIQIKGLDSKELKLKANALENEIADLIMDKNMKKLKDLKAIGKKRKDLAQVLTVLRQKEQLAVISSEMSDKSQSVVSQSETDNRKAGGKK